MTIDIEKTFVQHPVLKWRRYLSANGFVNSFKKTLQRYQMVYEYGSAIIGYSIADSKFA